MRLQIRVVYNGVTQERTVERKFKVSTAVIGMITYLTGLYWAWQYPDHVMIRLPEAPSETLSQRSMLDFRTRGRSLESAIV